MKNHIEIARLREQGFRVWVEHYRDPEVLDPAGMAKLLIDEGYEFDRHGKMMPLEPPQAATIVTISRPPGDEGGTGYIVAQGKSFCSRNDQWNRRLGLTIALGRALKRMDVMA